MISIVIALCALRHQYVGELFPDAMLNGMALIHVPLCSAGSQIIRIGVGVELLVCA